MKFPNTASLCMLSAEAIDIAVLHGRKQWIRACPNKIKARAEYSVTSMKFKEVMPDDIRIFDFCVIQHTPIQQE
jgi:hypothetical protein